MKTQRERPVQRVQNGLFASSHRFARFFGKKQSCSLRLLMSFIWSDKWIWPSPLQSKSTKIRLVFNCYDNSTRCFLVFYQKNKSAISDFNHQQSSHAIQSATELSIHNPKSESTNHLWLSTNHLWLPTIFGCPIIHA